ncbi:antitoxin Xre/MbcA/ParS toxin-binding domain-containing protein [Aeromonas media]|uniref:antitoxin Xre/MbcA/ParS toxin-binding domain-containing protein n=1 Tax=Aeromonas media TaxID=651 RepID=UPI00160007C7|nr:antitoxin Xre/MbcA/ParS toxin-binding domain-containing protein [Aeromonas media]
MYFGTAYKPKARIVKPVSLLTTLSLPKQPIDAHMKILTGFSPDIVARLSLETQIDEATICRWVGISHAAYHRKNKADKKIFSVEQSGRLYIFIRILDAAIQLFNGDISAAVQWLKSPARSFGDETPLQMLRTPTGAEAVMSLIGCVGHGVIL